VRSVAASRDWRYQTSLEPSDSSWRCVPLSTPVESFSTSLFALQSCLFDRRESGVDVFNFYPLYRQAKNSFCSPVVLAGTVVMIVIRAPHRHRSRVVKVAPSNKTPVHGELIYQAAMGVWYNPRQ